MARGLIGIGVTAVVFGAAGFLAGLTVAAREETGSSHGATDGSIEAVPRGAVPAGVPASAAPAADGAVGADPASRDEATDGGSAAVQLRTRLGRVPPPGREQEAERLAAKIRRDASARAQLADYDAAHIVLASIQRDEELAADAARGGTIAMLRKLASSGGTMLDTAGSSEAMAKHFQRSAPGPEIAAADLNSDAALTNGTTVRFGPGFHKMAVSRIGADEKPFPDDLVLAGEGMDRTLVRFDKFGARSVVRNLTFRDMTIDCGETCLFELRNVPATIRMERCRVIGFDTGSGNSAMLSAPSAAFFASDCRFEAGFARARAGFGSLFSTPGLVARLERCTVIGPFRSVFEWGSAKTTVFAACDLRRMPVDFATWMSDPPKGVRFDGCANSDPHPGKGLDPAHPDPAFLATIAAGGGTSSVRVLARDFPAAFAWLPAEFDLTPLFTDPPEAVAVDGSAISREDRKRPAVSARFSSGAFDFTFPDGEAALVVSGAGMDSTLLRMRGSPRAKILIYRDLTIDCSYGDILSSSASLVGFSRCRLIAFDSGSGGSTAIDSRGDGMLWLSDCRIESGYGRSPGRATAFCLSSNIVARVDRTTITLLGDTLFSNGGPNLALLNCHVTGAKPGTLASAQHGIAAMPGTTIEEVPAGFTAPRQPRPLTDINPSWTK